MSDERFATWFSRILRWLIAAFFGWIAYNYHDLWFMYLPAATALFTSFLKPVRCTGDSCKSQ